MRKPFTFIICIITIIVLLSVVQIVVSNRLSTTGITLSKIETSMKTYRTQNIVLTQELLEKSSLFMISSKAAELGFVEAKTQYVLSSPLPLAVKR